MAKKHAGDWRNPARIRQWASELSRALPTARPRPAIVPKGHSLADLFGHAVLGWALCAAVMGLLLRVSSLTVALTLHALAAPTIFALLARHYFGRPGAREPMWTALAFAGSVALLDLVVVAGLIQRSLEMFGSIAGTWLPFGLIFAVTWATGAVKSMMPLPTAAKS